MKNTKISIENLLNKIRDKIDDITPSFVYRLSDFFKNIWYGIFIRRHWLIYTGLPIRSWFDSDTRMLHGMMAVLKEFYEKELSLNIVDWESDKEHKHVKSELDTIYQWWKNYEARQKEITDIRNEWSDRIDIVCLERGYGKGEKDTICNFLHYLNDQNRDSLEIELNNILHEKETKLLEEEEEMLIRLIKIRRFMWT